MIYRSAREILLLSRNIAVISLTKIALIKTFLHKLLDCHGSRYDDLLLLRNLHDKSFICFIVNVECEACFSIYGVPANETSYRQIHEILKYSRFIQSLCGLNLNRLFVLERTHARTYFFSLNFCHKAYGLILIFIKFNIYFTIYF